MQRQIPTAEELHLQVTKLVALVDPETRKEWLEHKCTQAIFLLLEASRMQAIEALEEGPDPERMKQMAAQSQLASTLVTDLAEYIVSDPEEDADDGD